MKRHFLFLLILLLAPLSLAAQDKPLFGWASKDIHYAENARPVLQAARDTVVRAWRGERLGVQALVYAPAETGSLQLRATELRAGSRRIAADRMSVRFVNYVLTNCYNTCGYPPTDKLAPYGVADVIALDEAQRLPAATARPVWCTVEVPADAAPGLYRTRIELVDSASRRVVGTLSLGVDVLSRTLPSPREQAFHVDFWQQPYAVSRFHGVPRWSDEHFELLKPYLRLLARSGQRVVSAILFYEPWGEQSVDKFDPMVQTTRHADGTWSYDYSVFDRWVELCAACGIDRQINCFSMVPWDMTFRYYDEARHAMNDLRTTTDTPEYRELWTAFIRSFAAHLKEKGWYDRTCIAMDERGLGSMLDAWRIVQEAAPGMRMALAGTYHKELADKLYDYCIAYGENFTPEERADRRARGLVSTTYTCCSSPEPNLFSNSLPAEAAFLPVYCVANGFDGYLHWSWMNWNDTPLTDSRFRMFAPGDTYCIYPGPRSSVRYERFIEGVAMAEKIRLLRSEYAASGDKAAAARLDRLVSAFAPTGIPQGTTAARMVNELQQELNRK